MTEHRTVTIPGCIHHAGAHAVSVTLDWRCPTCGERRGEAIESLSYDGSRRLVVHTWQNACGHVDSYRSIRLEAGTKHCGGDDRWPHG